MQRQRRVWIVSSATPPADHLRVLRYGDDLLTVVESRTRLPRVWTKPSEATRGSYADAVRPAEPPASVPLSAPALTVTSTLPTAPAVRQPAVSSNRTRRNQRGSPDAVEPQTSAGPSTGTAPQLPANLEDVIAAAVTKAVAAALITFQQQLEIRLPKNAPGGKRISTLLWAASTRPRSAMWR